jgi:hypothetical protein
MRRLLAAVGVLLALAGATYLAGEQTEVVVLRTFASDGTVHETKMWAVDHDGAVWVRVANPRRLWYQRILAEPRVELARGGETLAMLAAPAPEAQHAVDEVFAAKYGWVDTWYGLLLRREAVPVRLTPAARAPQRG